MHNNNQVDNNTNSSRHRKSEPSQIARLIRDLTRKDKDRQQPGSKGTLAIGEDGQFKPLPKPGPKAGPIKTLAIGEDGQSKPLPVFKPGPVFTTMAIGEDGQSKPLPVFKLLRNDVS